MSATSTSKSPKTANGSRARSTAKTEGSRARSEGSRANSGTNGKRRQYPSKQRRKKDTRIPLGVVPVSAIIMVLLVTIAVVAVRPRLHHMADFGDQVPENSFSYLVDISHHQKDVEWDSLAVMTDARGRTVRKAELAVRVKAPDYVVMKASEGVNFKDDRFAEWWTEAGKRHIRRGAYHFFRAEKDPIKQVDNFIGALELAFIAASGPVITTDSGESSVCNGAASKDGGESSGHSGAASKISPAEASQPAFSGELSPVLDVEIKPARMSNRDFNARVLECLHEMETRLARKPIIYSSDNFIRDVLDSDIKDEYEIWVAHYNCKKPLTENWSFWQFTDKAVVYGISGKVDLSVIR